MVSPRKPRTPRPAHSVLLNSLQSACSTLELDKATSSVAWRLLSRMAEGIHACQLKEHIDTVDNQRAWMLCSLFAACRLSEGEAPSVTRLLNYCGVKLTHFCRHLHHFMAHMGEHLPEVSGTLLLFAVCCLCCCCCRCRYYCCCLGFASTQRC